MTNAEMTPNRFGRWAAARAKVARIKAHLLSGGVVQIGNPLGSTLYKTAAHAAMFEARKTGAYVRTSRSRRMVCFDGCAVRFLTYKVTK